MIDYKLTLYIICATLGGYVAYTMYDSNSFLIGVIVMFIGVFFTLRKLWFGK